MFGFGKKVKERIEPAFEKEDSSSQNQDKSLADILGAQDNDTNITAGVDAILDEESALDNGQGEISQGTVDFAQLENDESQGASELTTDETFPEETDDVQDSLSYENNSPDMDWNTEVSSVGNLEIDDITQSADSSEGDVSLEESTEIPEFFDESSMALPEDSNVGETAIDDIFEKSFAEAAEMSEPLSPWGEEETTEEISFTEDEKLSDLDINNQNNDSFLDDILNGNENPESNDVVQDNTPFFDRGESNEIQMTDFTAGGQENIRELDDLITPDFSKDEELLENLDSQNEISSSFEPLEDLGDFSSESSEANDVFPDVGNSVDMENPDNQEGISPSFETLEDLGDFSSESLETNDIFPDAENPINEENFDAQNEISSSLGAFDEVNSPSLELADEGEFVSGFENQDNQNVTSQIFGGNFEETSSTDEDIAYLSQESNDDVLSEDIVALAPKEAVPFTVSEGSIESYDDTISDESVTVDLDNELWTISPFEELAENPKIINENSGIVTWGGDKYQSDIKIEINTLQELENWSVMVLHDFSVPLDENKTEVVIDKAPDVVRYACLMHNGQEILKVFNQSSYKFISPQGEFFAVQGNVICGHIDKTFSLSIHDYVRLPIQKLLNQLVLFKKPSSGFILGPKGVSVFFATARAVAFRMKEELPEPEVFEYEPSLKKFDSRKNFIYDEKAGVEEFMAKGKQTCLVVNTGTSLFGWNVYFDNEVYMSLQDLLVYQAKQNKLPSPNGELSHNGKTFKFFGVEKIQARPKVLYYSYGKV